MADTKLRQTQQQKLLQTLSPLQVQYVRLLEMNGHELENEISKTVDENAALEIVSDADHEAPDAANDFGESAEELQRADYGSEEEIPYAHFPAPSGQWREASRYEPVAVAGEGSVMEQIMAQLGQTDLDERSMRIAAMVAGNIDDNGYMTRDTEAIADDLAITEGIDTTPREVESVLGVIQTLDPPGIGARDLRECLLLQLQRRPSDPDTDLAVKIIRDNFSIFSRMDLERLAKVLKVTPEQLRSAMNVIRALNPKPGGSTSASGDEKTREITPDFHVDADGDNLSLTLLNTIPELQIERTFAGADVEITPRTPRYQAEAKEFIRRSRDDAAAFIKAMSMRQETLWRVMGAIMKIQRDFFLSDDERDIKPMILKDVAALTGYDVSVVSRATSGKYVSTRGGVYSLKSLFNERPTTEEDVSSIEIVNALKEIVAAEDKQSPLSDEALTAALARRGYRIARRTVAKYRERAKIPVARLRRNI